MKYLPLLACAAVAALPVAPAHAQGDDSRRSETVRYADLDLKKPEGAVTLFHRLRTAASDVCAMPPGRTDDPATPSYRRCVDHALGDAVAAVDSSQLTTYAQAHGVAVSAGTESRPQ